jgi:4-aminobutyrate aminotransferase-like enzyme
MIDHDENVAAIIVEPIVGTNGVLVPPPEYLPRLAEQAKKRGVLLIADEVMAGWGRTGKWFACEHYGITPDILTHGQGHHQRHGAPRRRRHEHAHRRSSSTTTSSPTATPTRRTRSPSPPPSRPSPSTSGSTS